MIDFVYFTRSAIFLKNQYGMFLSDDAGNYWQEVVNGFPDFDNNEAAALSGSNIVYDGKNIFLGCNNGVFYSDDKGKKWIDISNTALQKSGVGGLVIVGSNLLVFTAQKSYWKIPIADAVK